MGSPLEVAILVKEGELLAHDGGGIGGRSDCGHGDGLSGESDMRDGEAGVSGVLACTDDGEEDDGGGNEGNGGGEWEEDVDIRRGLNSVSKIINEHGIDGVFGPVLELVDCEEKFFTAVEVTAGNMFLIDENIQYCMSNKKITDLITEQQQMDAEHDYTKSKLEQVNLDIASALKQRGSLENALVLKEKLVDNIRDQIAQTRSSIVMKNNEMGTDFIDKLTSEERDLLSRLNPEITELKEKFLIHRNNRIQIETRKEELETNLSMNLIRRQLELEAIISSADSRSLPLETESKDQELKNAKRNLNQLTSLLKDNVDAINNFTTNMDEKKRQRDDLKTHKAILEKTVQDGAKDLERLMNIRRIHLNKQEECMKKIRDLGSLPADTFEAYRFPVLLCKRNNKKQLQKMLYDCNKQLKKFSHDGDAGDDDNDEDGPHDSDTERRIEKYIGVKVKVSFTGKGETQSMKQLSGGQKTVVALTLIFAIQRCDPAPFYLFDEIDAALDQQYRTSVANMIRRLADLSGTQFIATTFRPEIVEVSDKIYGVTHNNRVSYINVVSKEQALDFIENDQTHNAS
ncbi:hypothetical protein HU200_043008 [Digitaria exilis]|uniref:RecF/RecN/SMC N-terminal domain-containing protein n=1 Tax=Digitaria exilis TaxID=1010633 RepID=A0A835BC11_9POAL|nr:hypothetical protein HU200_043008 [Digitaria exilis]